jgi:hypothetical protein
MGLTVGVAVRDARAGASDLDGHEGGGYQRPRACVKRDGAAGGDVVSGSPASVPLGRAGLDRLLVVGGQERVLVRVGRAVRLALGPFEEQVGDVVVF